MYRVFYLIVVLGFFGINAFSDELHISWNKKIYNSYENSLSYEYQEVNEVIYGKDVTVFLEAEPFQEIYDFVFRLYYNENNLVLQKTVNRVGAKYKDKYLLLEINIMAEIEYLKQMKLEDTLFYKCTIEFPSGEIYASKQIKAIFVFELGLNADIANINDESFLLKSSDDEFYQILNLKENGYMKPNSQKTKMIDDMIFIQFNNILPDKIYSLHPLDDEGRPYKSILDGFPFHFLVL